jgi:cation:H+ antiporter
MFWDFSLLVAGGLMLYFGADWFVRGAAGLAIRLGVRPLLIGLTVVSYATSAPELSVSMLAALEGKSAISLGNVIGSNIANIGLILGLTALIAPPRTDGSLIMREVAVLAAATLALPLLLIDGEIDRLDGVLLTASAVAFTYLTIRWSRSRPVEEQDLPIQESTTRPMLAVLIVGGLVVLVLGGEVFVGGAVGIAKTLGVSDRVIGLTVVALGTSLPELAASLVAALKGHSELAVGNVVGSNIFNLLLILGVTGMVVPIFGVIEEVEADLLVLGALTLLLAVALRSSRKLTRVEGVLMLGGYLGFTASTLVGGRL